MKVSIAPKLAGINPYQDQLINHLSNLSANIQSVEWYRAFLPSAVSDWQPDVVHLHWIHQYLDTPSRLKSFVRFSKFAAGLFILGFQGKKIVWTAHNLKSHDSKHPALDDLSTQIVVKLSNAVIAHSEAAKQEIITQYGVKCPGKIFVIPHANYIGQYPKTCTQTQAREQLKIPNLTFVFLFFGLIRAYKGVPEILAAFDQLPKDQNIHLMIAGSAKDSDLIAEIKQHTQADPRIKLEARFIPDDEVQVYMNASDVVLLPYRQFLTSGAVLLAMSFAKACVAPDQGCIPEVLDDQGAFLYDPDQPDSLLHAMQAALAQKETIAQMGQHNYTKAQEWSWEFVAQKNLDVYESCLHRGKP
ncbi:MAG: glycosyltransferase family 4 protein [Leptolyngbyaceae cyanobacterium]